MDDPIAIIAYTSKLPTRVHDYSGVKRPSGPVVQFQRQERALTYKPVDDLPLRLDLADHSPDGFNWGYSGSGPAQLALAILAHCTGSDALALRCYQSFKEDVVCRLPWHSWVMWDSTVLEWVQSWSSQTRAPAVTLVASTGESRTTRAHRFTSNVARSVGMNGSFSLNDPSSCESDSISAPKPLYK